MKKPLLRNTVVMKQVEQLVHGKSCECVPYYYLSVAMEPVGAMKKLLLRNKVVMKQVEQLCPR